MNNQTITITMDHAATIVNVLAYEYYARLKRRYMRVGLERRPSFEEFLVECDKHLELDMLPTEAWECGYELIADLFEDNERFGTPCDEEAQFAHNVMQLMNMFSRR